MKLSKLMYLTLLLTLSCNIDDDNSTFNDNCITGAGAIVSESRSVDSFHSIENTAVAEIFLTQGPQEDLLIEAQQNILQILDTEVVDNKLTIKFVECVDITQAVKIAITIPEIKSLSLTGVGNIVAQNDFDLTSLDVQLTGVGTIDLRGTTDILDILLTGVGNVAAFGLNANVCDVRITGIGDVEVFVNDELNVTITGAGTVFYKGNPTINSNITGSGEIVDSN